MALKREDLFTQRAEAALAAAQEAAKADGAPCVTTAHILIGLAGLREGTALQLLRAAKLTASTVHEQMATKAGDKDNTSRGSGFSIGAELAIQDAHREAKMEACRRVGSEHLLLGLIEARETTASHILNDAGLRLAYYRQHLATARDLARATSGPGHGTHDRAAAVGGSEADALAVASGMAPQDAPAPPVADAPQGPAQRLHSTTYTSEEARTRPRAGAADSPVIQEILAANSKFLSGPSTREEPPERPRRHLAILTCIDCRLTDFFDKAMGIERGDAAVIRNAGAWPAGRDDVVRSLCIAVHLQGVTDIIVLGHTDCGMTKFHASAFLDALGGSGVSRTAIDDSDIRGWTGALGPSVERNVTQTVEDLRRSPLFPPTVRIHGMVIDTLTGKLDSVC